MNKIGMMGLAALFCASVTQAADILRLEGSTDLTDLTYWENGVLPGSTNLALFNESTVTDTNGVTYTGAGNAAGAGSATWGFGGYKIVNTAGPVTFYEGNVQYYYGLGIVVSNATGGVSFESIRSNKATPSAEWYIHTGDVLRANIAAGGSRHYYTIPITGGGSLLVNGSAAVSSGTRMSFNVYGDGTTIGGTGLWQPNTCNTTYGIEVGTNTVVSPGDGGVGTMTIDSLYDNVTCLGLADGAIFKFDIAGSDGGTFALPNEDADLIKLTGMSSNDVVFEGTAVIDLDYSDENIFESAVFKLFDTDLDATTWSGLTISNNIITGGLIAVNLVNEMNYKLIVGDGTTGDPGDIYLQIGTLSESYEPTNKTWAKGSDYWDVNTSLNWLDDDSVESVYMEEGGIGDYVTFGDTDFGGGTVSLYTNVYPSGLIVNSADNYIIDGSGSINGGMALLKSGTGSLTLGTANSYYGGTVIGGGSVIMRDAEASLGAGPVTLTNDSVFCMYGGNVSSSATATTFANTLIVPAGETATVWNTGRGYWTGDVQGSGTLNVRVTYLRGELQNDWSGFSGQLNVTSLNGSADEFRLASSYTSYDFSNARINLGDGVIMYCPGTQSKDPGDTQYIGELSGSTNAIIGSGPIGGRKVTWSVGHLGTDSTFAGTIKDYSTSTYASGDPATCNLTKVGSGTLTLSNTSTYTGTTTVNDGTLDVSGSIVSPVTINGGTLAVSGSVTNDITVNGGALAVSETAEVVDVTAASGGAVTGLGTVGGNLTLNDGAVLVLNTNGCLQVAGAVNITTNSFSAANIQCDDWSSLEMGVPYYVLEGYTNTVSGFSAAEYDLGDGRAAHLEEGFGLYVMIAEATVIDVPAIGSFSVADGSVSLSWDGDTAFNVYTNSDLINSNGWGVATNSASPAVMTIGEEDQLFYKLGN